jgi:hypothetical protein
LLRGLTVNRAPDRLKAQLRAAKQSLSSVRLADVRAFVRRCAGWLGLGVAFVARLIWLLFLEVLTLALVVAAAPAFYWRVLTTDPLAAATFPAGDFTELHYPFRRWVAEQLARGETPWWNQFILGGQSAIGDIQFHVMYPPEVLLATLLGPGFPLQGYEAGVVAHVALGALFTYLLARRLTASRIGGLVAALVFGFGGYLATYPIQQVIILETSVWLPLILLLIDIGADTGIVLFYLVAGGALALAALAGHPQTLFYVATVSLLYGLFKAWHRGRIRIGALVGIPVLLAAGAALSADALVPAFLHLGLTDRTNVTYAFSSGGFSLREAVGIVFPVEFGGAALYFGVFSLVLAGIAVASPRRRSNKLFWVSLAIVGLLFSFGGNTFLQGMLYVALGSFKFRDHERTIFFAAIAIAVLAGYGAAELTRPGSIRPVWLQRSVRWPVGLIATFVLLLMLGFAITPNDSRENVLPIIDRAGFTAVVLVLGAAILLGRERGILRPGLAGLLTVALVGFDLFSTNWQQNLKPGDPEQLLGITPVAGYLQSYTSGLYRMASEGLLPGDGNAGALLRIEDVVGNTPLETSDFAQFEKTVPESTRWQILNVRYVLTQRKLNDPRFTTFLQDGPRTLYELAPRARLPRGYVVESVVTAPTFDGALGLVQQVDLRQTAVVESPSNASQPFASLLDEAAVGRSIDPAMIDATATPVRVVSDEGNDVELTANLSKPGLVVLNDVMYPGWTATIDDQPATIFRANGIVRAVFVSAGTHDIRYHFEPPGLRLGQAIRDRAVGLAPDLVAAEALIRLAIVVVFLMFRLARSALAGLRAST